MFFVSVFALDDVCFSTVPYPAWCEQRVGVTGVSGADFAVLAQFADHNSSEYKSEEAKKAKHLIECDRLAWYCDFL